jgi:ABC-type antimicrobial peptide transport system permease subunit
VVAYSVLQRRKEIGVRLALGASQRDLRRLIFKNGMVPVFAGLGIGLFAAALLVRLIASLLFEVSTLDPLAFIGAPLILVLAAAIPCWVNARQAGRIDPMVALRFD